jgi:hypothetical protein
MSGPSGLDNFLNDITGNKNGDSRNINVDLS